MEKDLNNLSKQDVIALFKQQQEALFLAQSQQEKILSQSQELIQQNQKLSQEKNNLEKESQKLSQEKNSLEQENKHLQLELAHYKQKLFGQKKERFLNENQLHLPFAKTEQQEQISQEKVEKKKKEVQKRVRKSHPGRYQLPENLPVEIIEIHPEGDLSDMKVIGTEITEELDCKPLSFFIRRYVRYKYAPNNKDEKPVIGNLPERVIDKGIPSAHLLAFILVNKYVDHLPLYRQKQQFKRAGIDISDATINHWVQKGMNHLEILYECLLEDIKSSSYLQVDETPIKILKSEKKGACHQGYYWAYHAPIEKLVLFEYHSTRGFDATQNILKDFKGYLQTDGYAVYDKIAKKKDIIHIPCLAHIRRKFFDAQANDQELAGHALLMIQEIYHYDRLSKELDGKKQKEYQVEHILPLFKKMGEWLFEQTPQTLPKSLIGKACHYALERWIKMQDYLLDPLVQLDNNWIENAIRPIVVGRKNYLFAGSSQAAQKAAMMYSFFAICKKHDVNPLQWLTFLFDNIQSYKISKIRDLFPQNFQKIEK